MNKSYGIDTNIKTERGNYLIETYADSNQFMVISEIFFEGKIIEMKEVPYESTISEDGLIKLIQKLQNSIISDFERLFNLDKEIKDRASAENLFKIGRLYFKRKLLGRAQESFRKCISIAPEFADGYKGLGQILMLLEKYSESEMNFRKALQLETKRADYHFHLGRLLFTVKRDKEAEKCFTKALELNSDYAEAYFYQGAAMLRQLIESSGSRLDDKMLIPIKVALKNASILDQRFREKGFNEAFDLLEEKLYIESLDKFIDFSQRFMEIEAHDVIDEFNLFAKYSKKKISLLTVDEYINNIRAMIEEHPEYADLHNALGKAYILKIRALLNASTLQFQKALEINPDYIEAKKNIELVENEGKGFLLLLRAILK
jgi:tetratricopeptide (TPR) repeat protein